jgi:hypothetical protein
VELSFSRPFGTRPEIVRYPALKRPGYFHESLRDREERP